MSATLAARIRPGIASGGSAVHHQRVHIRGEEHVQRMPLDRERALASYREGVAAICELAASLTDWSVRTPCAGWQVHDVAGHLRCVAENHHEYLDEAPNSRLAKLMGQDERAPELVSQVARQNAAELAALPQATGPEHIAAFAAAAESYAQRLPDSWDSVLYTYLGEPYTAGDAVGAACVEWHLHAWDLARASGWSYRPRDPELLVAGWRVGIPYLSIDGPDPWEAVIVTSGRPPSWPQEVINRDFVGHSAS